MPRIRPVLACVGVAALALVACSSSGGGKPIDTAGLKKTLLTSGDLPSAWVAKAHDSSDDNSSDDAATNAKLATCIGVPKDKIGSGDDDKGKVYSPDFTLGQSSVSSESKPNDGGFGSALAKAVLTSDKTNGCLRTILRQSLTKTLPSGVSITKFDVAVVKPGADEPKNAQYEFTATIGVSSAGESVTVYLAFVDIQSKRVDATVNLQGFGTAIPSSVRAAALKAVSERVAAA